MKKTLKPTLLCLALCFLFAPGWASADDSFYETRFASGKQAYVEKRMPDAVTDLRIAAFGFLERPALLSETLVWLTLAETASARPERVRWALTRFLEVETKFHPYRQLALDAPSRTAFEKVLVSTLSSDAIASIPSLADLVAPAARRPQPGSEQSRASARQPAPKPAATRPPVVAAAPAAKTATSAASPPAAKSAAPPVEIIPVVPPPLKTESAPAAPAQAPKSAPGPSGMPAVPQSLPAVVPKKAAAPVAVPAAPVPSAEEQAAQTIEKAKALLGQNRNDEAFRMLSDLVGRMPSRTARKYLLHAATRTHNWQTAAAQVPQVEPFRTGEEVTMFYAAVALYHAGKTAEARPLLERSLPGVNPSPYVESYKQKILGRR